MHGAVRSVPPRCKPRAMVAEWRRAQAPRCAESSGRCESRCPGVSRRILGRLGPALGWRRGATAFVSECLSVRHGPEACEQRARGLCPVRPGPCVRWLGMHEARLGVGACAPPGDVSTPMARALLHLHADDAPVTLDGRALYSLDTSLPRSETQRHPLPADSRPRTAFGELGIVWPLAAFRLVRDVRHAQPL